MSKRGFVSPAKAADMLGIHRNTAYGWARNAATGEASRFKKVERHPITGYLSIPVDEIHRIKQSDDE